MSHPVLDRHETLPVTPPFRYRVEIILLYNPVLHGAVPMLVQQVKVSLHVPLDQRKEVVVVLPHHAISLHFVFSALCSPHSKSADYA